MKSRGWCAALFVFAILVPAWSASAQTPRMYTVQELGSFGGADLVGLAINNNGDVAGYAYLADGTIHAFRWTRAGGLEDLGANGGSLSQAYGINDNGDAVGVYYDPVANEVHGFLAPRNGPMQDLRQPGRPIYRVSSITNDGQMTGLMLPTIYTHAYRTLADGTLQDIGSDGHDSAGLHINNAGDVTGAEVHDNAESAFRYSTATGKVDLGTLAGGRSSGLWINNAGVVVGWSESVPGEARAFRARPGFALEDLGTLGGEFTGASAINDTGDIVGWSGSAAFVLYNGAQAMIDLNAQVPPVQGWRLFYNALGINEAGQILVLYYSSAGPGTAVLTPVVDTQAPVITQAEVAPNVLRPANGSMRAVTVSVTAVDDVDPAPVCAITRVTNSQWRGSGQDPSVEITGALTLSLRASRQGPGNERIYRITVRCTDASNNHSRVRLVVRVPHGHH